MRSVLNTLIAIVITLLAIGVSAQEPAAGFRPPNERIAVAGESFSDPRLGLSFIVPLKSVIRVRKRGNFHGVDIEPVLDAAYFLYHTSYRIRRPEGVGRKLTESLRAVFGPCEIPPIPAGPDFETNARCEGTVGLNDIVRHIRLIRDGRVLHLLHISSRADARDLAGRIFASVRKNEEFARRFPL